jgi:thioredoxin reductase
VVVGAGPAGLTAAIFARNKGLRVVVIEGLAAGGQMRALYPYKPVYNYPGNSHIRAGELVDKIIAQVRENGIEILEGTPVRDVIRREGGDFSVVLDNSEVISRAIVLACGMGLFNHRRLGIPGEELLRNRSVFYTLNDLPQWEGKRIAVVGGGNSAVDNALFLLEQMAEVTIIHKLTSFQAEAGSVAKLHERCSKVFLGWSATEFSSCGPAFGSVDVLIGNPTTREKQVISVHRVLINIGIRPSSELIERLSCSLENHMVRVDTEMQTSIHGIFACGDTVSYPGKTRLIVTALGEAATAVNSVERYLKAKSQSLVIERERTGT